MICPDNIYYVWLVYTHELLPSAQNEIITLRGIMTTETKAKNASKILRKDLLNIRKIRIEKARLDHIYGLNGICNTFNFIERSKL